jgi:hypothetical protein
MLLLHNCADVKHNIGRLFSLLFGHIHIGISVYLGHNYEIGWKKQYISSILSIDLNASRLV